jgi:hypothetical protein
MPYRTVSVVARGGFEPSTRGFSATGAFGTGLRSVLSVKLWKYPGPLCFKPDMDCSLPL